MEKHLWVTLLHRKQEKENTHWDCHHDWWSLLSLTDFSQSCWKTAAVLFQIIIWDSTCFFCCQDKLSILNVAPHDHIFDLHSSGLINLEWRHQDLRPGECMSRKSGKYETSNMIIVTRKGHLPPLHVFPTAVGSQMQQSVSYAWPCGGLGLGKAR